MEIKTIVHPDTYEGKLNAFFAEYKQKYGIWPVWCHDCTSEPTCRAKDCKHACHNALENPYTDRVFE